MMDMKSKLEKWKIKHEEIFTEYYESQIFSDSPEGSEIGARYFFTDAYVVLGCLDEAFKKVDEAVFFQELCALNIELFGLGWLNYNYKLSHEYSLPEKSLTQEIMFTKQYLQKCGRGILWDKMGFYNGILLDVIGQETSLPTWDRFRDLPSPASDSLSSLKEEVTVKKVDSAFKSFGAFLSESESTKRLATRFIFVPYNIDRMVALSQNISQDLSAKLQIIPSQKGLFILQQLIIGLHQNAVNYLGTVQEWGSYPAFRNARNKTLANIVNSYHKQANKQ
jgi:hypothetical protein